MCPHLSYKQSNEQQKKVQNCHPQELNDILITKSVPPPSARVCVCMKKGSPTVIVLTCAAITSELVFSWFGVEEHATTTREALFTRRTAVPQHNTSNTAQLIGSILFLKYL